MIQRYVISFFYILGITNEVYNFIYIHILCVFFNSFKNPKLFIILFP